jgi:hypothetical protein
MTKKIPSMLALETCRIRTLVERLTLEWVALMSNRYG